MNFAGILATWPGRIGVLALVGVIGGGGIMYARGNTAAPAAAPRTATVTKGSVSQTVTVSGSINALGQARLAFKSGGKIAQIYVATGQAVTLGQPLAKLDTTDLEAAVATAQQNLANAQASYQKQVLSANDTRQAYADAQKSTANDIATAQTALAKLRTNYANAKANFTSVTNTLLTDIASYRAAVDTMHAQVQSALNDLNYGGNSDVQSARTSLFAADGSITAAQIYGTNTISMAVSEYSSARDGILGALQAFDTALASGGDTSAPLTNFQTLQLNFSTSSTRLTTALDTLVSQISGAQSSTNSAQTSLSTTNSRANITLEQARTDVTALQGTFTSAGQYPAVAKSRVNQVTTPLNTMADAVNGSLANAATAITTAQDRAATTLRSAASAVANIPLNLQSAQVSVDNANNAVATASSNLDSAVLSAPAAGIVASIANQVGEFVTGGNTNSAFMVLTNTQSLVLHGTIGESDVAKLKLGQVANLTVDALTGQKMTGRVVSLDPVATIQSGVPVYGIDIAVDVPASSVKAGMSASASVILASKQNVLTVPNTAIRTINGQRGVQVLAGGEIVDTAATFGLSNDTVTEVVSGLSEGDIVVIPTVKATSSSANPRGGGGVQIQGPGQVFGK
jgi:multidrug efflux pump subunit AcrA (membrane-fusion protein)